MRRLNEEETAELIDLVFKSACDVLMKLRGLQEADFKFPKKSSYPRFSSSTNGLFKAVEASSGIDSIPDYSDVFANDDRLGNKFRYGEVDGFEELV